MKSPMIIIFIFTLIYSSNGGILEDAADAASEAIKCSSLVTDHCDSIQVAIDSSEKAKCCALQAYKLCAEKTAQFRCSGSSFQGVLSSIASKVSGCSEYSVFSVDCIFAINYPIPVIAVAVGVLILLTCFILCCCRCCFRSKK